VIARRYRRNPPDPPQSVRRNDQAQHGCRVKPGMTVSEKSRKY
jgi:hypothetical protein